MKPIVSHPIIAIFPTPASFPQTSLVHLQWPTMDLKDGFHCSVSLASQAIPASMGSAATAGAAVLAAWADTVALVGAAALAAKEATAAPGNTKLYWDCSALPKGSAS